MCVEGVDGAGVSGEGIQISEESPQAPVPTRIRQAQRIVHQKRIAVVALQHAGRLDEGVGGHEAVHQRVVDAPVHVDEAHLVQVLVLCKAAVGGAAHQAVGDVGRAIYLAPLAPRVVGHAFDDAARRVGDGGDGA